VKRVLVIGAGPGGEAAAKRAAARGAQVVLVEKRELGGLCLNRGCIPSKTLLEAGRLLHRAQGSSTLAGKDGLRLDWAALQKKKDSVVTGLRNALAQSLQRLGVRVVQGEARFIDARKVSVNGEEVPFDAAVVAAGSAPFFPPPLDGMMDRLLDSDRALTLPAVPESLLVVGGGAIGCEFACLFHGLGARVTLVEKTAALLPGEDPAIVRVLQTSFEKRGIRVVTGATVQSLSGGPGAWKAALSDNGTVEAAAVLVCVGRRPSSKAMAPEAAGIKTEGGRIPVNAHFQTNQPHIYAAGDVNGLSLLAHAASAQAEIAVDHLFGEAHPYDNALVPRCLYTWPEVASVGDWAHTAEAKGIESKSQRFFFQGSAKAMALEETEGFIQVVSEKKPDGRVLGAQIAGPHATDLIHVFSAALAAGMTVSALRRVIFAHPTLAEGVREALSR
jgi:dihydrolipoamide dehydrogenase